MTVQNLIAKAKAHNEAIDTFINVTLKEHFGGEKINVSQWFEAQRLISEQDFYNRAMAILKPLRSAGVDVKINMQSNKIYIPYSYR